MSDTLDALHERYSAPPPPPGSFTASAYARKFGLTRYAADSNLARMVADGALKQQRAVVGGKRATVFWIPEAADVSRRGKPRK